MHASQLSRSSQLFTSHAHGIHYPQQSNTIDARFTAPLVITLQYSIFLPLLITLVTPSSSFSRASNSRVVALHLTPLPFTLTCSRRPSDSITPPPFMSPTAVLQLQAALRSKMATFKDRRKTKLLTDRLAADIEDIKADTFQKVISDVLLAVELLLVTLTDIDKQTLFLIVSTYFLDPIDNAYYD
ncbi:hypothetical protein DL95DRAFT_469867 [Leptodontidium sp. 2 PMI_412]|nr:hypothetical protein DL95DRAFT_469867 [Leptodontidium sp. 2 PMI_412]